MQTTGLLKKLDIYVAMPLFIGLVILAVVGVGYLEITRDFSPIEVRGNLIADGEHKQGEVVVFSRTFCNGTEDDIVGSLGAIWRRTDGPTPDDIPVMFLTSRNERMAIIGYAPGCHYREIRALIPNTIDAGMWRVVGQSLIIGADSRFQGIPMYSNPFLVSGAPIEPAD